MFVLFSFGAYMLVFVPVDGLLPGVLPLFAYSTLFAFLIDPLIDKMGESNFKSHGRVAIIMLLSIFLGVSIYGLFFLISSHSGDVLPLLLSMVIPTSAIVGVWFGFSFVRKDF